MEEAAAPPAAGPREGRPGPEVGGERGGAAAAAEAPHDGRRGGGGRQGGEVPGLEEAAKAVPVSSSAPIQTLLFLTIGREVSK